MTQQPRNRPISWDVPVLASKSHSNATSSHQSPLGDIQANKLLEGKGQLCPLLQHKEQKPGPPPPPLGSRGFAGAPQTVGSTQDAGFQMTKSECRTRRFRPPGGSRCGRTPSSGHGSRRAPAQLSAGKSSRYVFLSFILKSSCLKAPRSRTRRRRRPSWHLCPAEWFPVPVLKSHGSSRTRGARPHGTRNSELRKHRAAERPSRTSRPAATRVRHTPAPCSSAARILGTELPTAGKAVKASRQASPRLPYEQPELSYNLLELYSILPSFLKPGSSAGPFGSTTAKLPQTSSQDTEPLGRPGGPRTALHSPPAHAAQREVVKAETLSRASGTSRPWPEHAATDPGCLCGRGAGRWRLSLCRRLAGLDRQVLRHTCGVSAVWREGREAHEGVHAARGRRWGENPGPGRASHSHGICGESGRIS